MLKKLIPLLSIFLILASITVTAFAHGGNTDSNGGHYNGSSYHYHHGYPAHQHTNGQCPYNFDDKTNHSSGSSSNGSTLNSTNNSLLPNALKVSAIILFLFIAKSYISHQKEKKERIKQEKIQYEKAMNELLPYRNKTNHEIALMCGMPPNIKINNQNLPELFINGIDVFTVYTSYSGKKYHKETCEFASYGKRTNLALIPEWKSPCLVCWPYKTDVSWYKKYSEICTLLKKYPEENNKT